MGSPGVRFCRLAALLLLAFACALGAPGTAAAGGPVACESAEARPAQVGEEVVVRSTLCLLNAERRRHGLRPLRLNDRLTRAARRHSQDMARHGYFDHTSRNGSSFVDRIRRTGYLSGARSWKVAENIAWGSHRLASPRAITRAWMDSPGHRANILDGSYREIGIGVATRSGPRALYTTDFGARG
jgi:uncharacterized protein YkwD